MEISAVSASGPLSLTQRREQDHQVQDVFSAVLAEAGREGYASAQAIDDQQPLTESIETSWNSWFTGEVNGRYQQAANPDELQQTFGEILVRAHNEGGYVDPKGFLQDLSEDDLAVVQKVQGLADRIQVDSLTEEGAINLLVPPAAQIDLNRDGLTRSGAAYGIRFPDSSTPMAVVTAWEEATQGMDFGELAVAQLRMKLPLLTANIVFDENGSFSHVNQPGDPQWKNPMAASDYSYVGFTEDYLAHVEFMKNKISPEKYEQQKSFWTNFQQLLVENNAQ